MAKRHTLHINAIDDFKKWLVCDGWELQNVIGDYEVIRAKKGKRLFIAFERLKDNLQHLSVSNENMGVVKAFYKSKKEVSE